MTAKVLINQGNGGDGTSLQGFFDITYADLVDVLGHPLKGDGHKVDAEWDLVFPNGIKATIYNYKTGQAYNGPSGVAVEDIRDWHIGGMGNRAVEEVRRLFPNHAILHA